MLIESRVTGNDSAAGIGRCFCLAAIERRKAGVKGRSAFLPVPRKRRLTGEPDRSRYQGRRFAAVLRTPYYDARLILSPILFCSVFWLANAVGNFCLLLESVVHFGKVDETELKSLNLNSDFF